MLVGTSAVILCVERVGFVQQFVILDLQKSQMQKQFKLKTKYSYSPGKSKENVYMVRAQINKKPSISQLNDQESKQKGLTKQRSLSRKKSHSKTSKLFKNAHQIESTETYLKEDKNNVNSNTNESSAPHSPREFASKIPGAMTSSDKTYNRSRSTGKKDIRQTVSITYKGKAKQVAFKNEMMTSLSKLILGEQDSHDDFYLEVLGQIGESSIHGEERFLELEDSFTFDDPLEAEGSA